MDYERAKTSLRGLVHIAVRPGWLEKLAAGAIKSAIDAHGSINHLNCGSAAKRIAGFIRAELKATFTEAKVEEFIEQLRQAHKKGGDAMRQLEQLTQDTRPGLLQSDAMVEVEGWITQQHLDRKDTNAICIWQFPEGQDKERMIPVTVYIVSKQAVRTCDGCGSLEHPAYHQKGCPRPGFTEYWEERDEGHPEPV